jgi:hypothetical protein
MSKALYVHISIELSGNTSPSLFADKVTEAMPTKLELETFRAATVPAELPVTFRIAKDKVSDPQSYLQISYSDKRGRY